LPGPDLLKNPLVKGMIQSVGLTWAMNRNDK
jgi:hypothetical protein